MRRPVFAVLLVLSAIMLSGCSMMAPQYSASIENVQMLKDGGELGAKVGKFQSKPSAENANPISLRGSSLNSPYEIPTPPTWPRRSSRNCLWPEN